MSLIQRMRHKVMHLHTEEQKKGILKAWKTPHPTLYLQYLAESRAVHIELQRAAFKYPQVHQFDYVSPLDRDLIRISDTFQLPIPPVVPHGPGRAYATLIRAKADQPPALMSHWYLIHFAHAAGGTIFGERIAQELLDGWVPEFYRPQLIGDVPDQIRAQLECEALKWNEKEQDDFLSETEPGFHLVHWLTESMFTSVNVE